MPPLPTYIVAYPAQLVRTSAVGRRFKGHASDAPRGPERDTGRYYG